MKTKSKETSMPASVCEELENLEKAFQQTLRVYSQRINSDLYLIRHSVESLKGGAKVSLSRIHDLRDMLMLIRKLEIKPEKGRRRDLKRVESLVEDLQGFVHDWEATTGKKEKTV